MHLHLLIFFLITSIPFSLSAQNKINNTNLEELVILSKMKKKKLKKIK